MALFQCPECRKFVEELDESCKHCGIRLIEDTPKASPYYKKKIYQKPKASFRAEYVATVLVSIVVITGFLVYVMMKEDVSVNTERAAPIYAVETSQETGVSSGGD